MALSINNNVDYLKLIEIANKHPRVNIFVQDPELGGTALQSTHISAHDDNNIAQTSSQGKSMMSSQNMFLIY